MKLKDEKERIHSEALRDVQISAFDNEMGQKVIVQRSTLKSEGVKRGNRLLHQAGHEIQQSDHALKQLDYVGCAAIHIFQSKLLGIIMYTSQTLLERCPEEHAGPAAHDLRNAMMGAYGHKPQKKRSGF